MEHGTTTDICHQCSFASAAAFCLCKKQSTTTRERSARENQAEKWDQHALSNTSPRLLNVKCLKTELEGLVSHTWTMSSTNFEQDQTGGTFVSVLHHLEFPGGPELQHVKILILLQIQPQMPKTCSHTAHGAIELVQKFRGKPQGGRGEMGGVLSLQKHHKWLDCLARRAVKISNETASLAVPLAMLICTRLLEMDQAFVAWLCVSCSHKSNPKACSMPSEGRRRTTHHRSLVS